MACAPTWVPTGPGLGRMAFSAPLPSFHHFAKSLHTSPSAYRRAFRERRGH